MHKELTLRAVRAGSLPSVDQIQTKSSNSIYLNNTRMTILSVAHTIFKWCKGSLYIMVLWFQYQIQSRIAIGKWDYKPRLSMGVLDSPNKVQIRICNGVAGNMVLPGSRS